MLTSKFISMNRTFYSHRIEHKFIDKILAMFAECTCTEKISKAHYPMIQKGDR